MYNDSVEFQSVPLSCSNASESLSTYHRLCSKSIAHNHFDKLHKVSARPLRIVYLIRVKGTPLLDLMRKIEHQMNSAISNNENWTSGNTAVYFNEEDQVSIVRLHGNKIAEIGDTFIRLFDGDHQTNTTKSRLNAILSEHGECGDKVFAKNFDWFVQMNTAQGLTVVPFWNSMRLG